MANVLDCDILVIVFNWNHFEMRLLNLRINFYLLRTFCPHLGSFFLVYFVCCFFFHYVSAKFHLWLSSGDLPRPRIGMMYLVTVFPVITAFHSCCLSHHVFWPSKPLAGLGSIWNRYLLTMLTWNRRDSMALSAAPRAPKGDQGRRRPEVKFGRNIVKEETTQKKQNKKKTRWGQKVPNK